MARKKTTKKKTAVQRMNTIHKKKNTREEARQRKTRNLPIKLEKGQRTPYSETPLAQKLVKKAKKRAKKRENKITIKKHLTRKKKK